MEKDIVSQAPGAPGIPAKWTTSSKDGVGTAIEMASNVYFTLSHGILNEVYFPRADRPAIRDMGLIITNGVDFFSEEKRHTNTETREMGYGIPAFEITNVCKENRYKIIKRVVTDSLKTVLIQQIEFVPLVEDNYHVFVLLAPHLNGYGNGNDGWVGTYKGHPILFAQRDGNFLAIACSSGWSNKSAGYVGVSDGWQDLNKHKMLTNQYESALKGNIALTGEIDCSKGYKFEITLGFGLSANEAAQKAISSLFQGFEEVAKKYISDWSTWQAQLHPMHASRNEIGGLFRISAAILRIHQSKIFSGAMVASLSIPWGEAAGDENESGYHLVWPRDLVQSAAGLLAINARQDVKNVLNYLVSTQEEDGHWPQNMWLEGHSYWNGIQLDETALPVLLMDQCREHNLLTGEMLTRYWPAVKKAVGYLLRSGIVTEQDRWEEQKGISVFTLATMISGVLAAADMAESLGEGELAQLCKETADAWNESIDYWLYATNTPLAKEMNVEGYYLRTNPGEFSAEDLGETRITIKNRPIEASEMPVVKMISIDPLALVRFGLRSADDQRILNTVKVIDAKLRKDTPLGPCWYRYVNDGYGEQKDGSPYNGEGTGRLWPLLTGERAHYEIAKGDFETAKSMLKALEAFSNNGLIPEQIWDDVDLPEKELYYGRHSHSAMPLVWAHAEHIKLVCSLKNEKIFDLPRHTYNRYIHKNTRSNLVLWRKELPVKTIRQGKILRIELPAAASIKWTKNHWNEHQEVATNDSGLGYFYVDLQADGGMLSFTFFWLDTKLWEGANFEVMIVEDKLTK